MSYRDSRYVFFVSAWNREVCLRTRCHGNKLDQEELGVSWKARGNQEDEK